MKLSLRDIQKFLEELGIRSLISEHGLMVSRFDMVTTSGQSTPELCYEDIRTAVFVNFEQDILVVGGNTEYVFWRI